MALGDGLRVWMAYVAGGTMFFSTSLGKSSPSNTHFNPRSDLIPTSGMNNIDDFTQFDYTAIRNLNSESTTEQPPSNDLDSLPWSCSDSCASTSNLWGFSPHLFIWTIVFVFTD